MTPQEKLKQQIQLLESLAIFDAQIRRLDTQIAEEQSSLDGLRKELTFLDGKLASDKASLDEMQRTAGELSIEARQMGGQIDKSREKLGRARNERESVAAEREVDELRKLLRDREDEVGKLNGLSDAARKTINEVQTQRDKVYTELTSTETGASARIVSVTADRERKIAERSEIAKKIPAPTLRRYENTLKKRGTGIAKVIDGTCRACHIELPPQQFQRLMRREAFEECPNCHRILYWTPEPVPGEEPA
jgi:uncharacterized protein